MLPLSFRADGLASASRCRRAPCPPRAGRSATLATTGVIALATFAAGASACTDTHVVLELPFVSTGTSHTCAISAGALYCWGRNDDGRLGIDNVMTQWSPVQVGTERDWRAVATGSVSSLALKVDGTMWSFGANHDGQLGLGVN